MGVDISIIHIYILTQELSFDFLRKNVFTPFRFSGLSVIVYWHLLVKMWVELFVSKDLGQVETVVSKKA